MNYYPFHIGDYVTHTAHLTPMEDCAYRRLLDNYYLTEQPLPADVKSCARLIRMRDNVEDVEQVLSEFFALTDAGWSHSRCDAELVRMKEKQEKAKASAQASVNARKAIASAKSGAKKPSSSTLAEQTGSAAPANAERALNERSANVELPTPTPTPTPVNTPPYPQGGRAGFDPLDLDDLGQPELPEPHELPRNTGGNSHDLAGAVCLMAKRMGIGLVNPGNSKLNALLNAGATMGQFEDAVHKALKAHKSFTYALSIVEREEREARELQATLSRPRVDQPAAKTQKSFAQQEREAGWARWEEMTGRQHPDRIAHQPRAVIDITPSPEFIQIGVAQ